jgi:hypothetical protein
MMRTVWAAGQFTNGLNDTKEEGRVVLVTRVWTTSD